MANYRQIHVSIWKDEWFLDLEPTEKLLFIYLFSNENTSLAGLYKIPLKVIVFETGLEPRIVIEIMAKFAVAGKAYYEDGVVWVVNMRRYHETRSDKVQHRINSDIALIPDCKLKIRYLYGMDTKTQLKEEEEEKEEEKEGVPTPANFSSSAEAERIFQEITGFSTFVPKTRQDDVGSVLALLRDHGKDTVEFCRPFYSEWLKRGYNKTNTAWLDWAVTGEIPQFRKNDRQESSGPHYTEVE